MNLTGRDFLTLKDFTPEEILYLIDLSAKLKDMKKKGIVEQPLRGKNVALIFEEAYVNVAVHGYAKKADNVKPLRILWDKVGDDYKMTFIDEGIYFDPTTYDIGEPKGDQVGGHGIRLMRELSKKMAYHKEGTENILEIWI